MPNLPNKYYLGRDLENTEYEVHEAATRAARPARGSKPDVNEHSQH